MGLFVASHNPIREPRVSASSSRISNTSVRSSLESTQIDFRSLPTTQCTKCLEIDYTTITHSIELVLASGGDSRLPNRKKRYGEPRVS